MKSVDKNLNICKSRSSSFIKIRIGHLDSGVDQNHIDLEDRVTNFVRFNEAGFREEVTRAFDDGFHGTHTAGIIFNNAFKSRPNVFDPDFELYSASVLQSGNVIVRILMGMEWLIEQKVHIALLPFGIEGFTPIFSSMISAMRERGILPIAAIGNISRNHKFCSPGCYPHVLSVGAVDHSNAVVSFSGRYINENESGLNKPDIYAPGVDISSALANSKNQQALLSGTSAASAYIAAVGANLWKTVPHASSDLIQHALLSTATAFKSDQVENNAGIVNPLKAMELLQSMNINPLAKQTSHNYTPSNSALCTHYRDQRLLNELSYARDDALIEAIVITNNQSTISNEELLEEVGALSNEKPTRVREVSIGRILIILASALFIKHLLNHQEVLMASATDVNILS